MRNLPKVLCIMGPTATGKSELAMALAREYPCELISVDSALVYRGMDIGTAKPSREWRDEIPHHCIDIRDPSEAYSAAEFANDASRLIKDIHERGNIPILVGGTLLYFRALQRGLSTLPSADPALREQLEMEAREKGNLSLYERLQVVDPIAAARIHQNDPQRIQRALEVYLLTGKTLSEHFEAGLNRPNEYDWVNVALIPADREQLRQKIRTRFLAMLAQGFVEEVEVLRARGDLHLDLPSMRAVGYRQIWTYLDGKISKAMMIEEGVQASSQLAKRQLTWLRSSGDHALNPDSPMLKTDIVEIMEW